MATSNKKAFDPDKTETSRKLSRMSGQELFERYFVEENGTEWFKDFRNERCKIEENHPLYPRINSLQGTPLQAIIRGFHIDVAGIAPLGYKLNGSILVKDLEAILSENLTQTTEAVKSKLNKEPATPFIIELTTFLSQRCVEGIAYYNSLLI